MNLTQDTPNQQYQHLSTFNSIFHSSTIWFPKFPVKLESLDASA